jgi:hypothetical protein
MCMQRIQHKKTCNMFIDPICLKQTYLSHPQKFKNNTGEGSHGVAVFGIPNVTSVTL